MVITKITGLRKEFSLPEVFSRRLVMDSSLLLEWQSSGYNHYYTYLIDTCPGALYWIINGFLF